jgi:hypothetical protein
MSLTAFQHLQNQKVRDQVKRNGGFSAFWPNRLTATAIERLKATGELEFIKGSQFPWSRARIIEK